ncbi:YecA family protein [Rhizobium leguminosarum]|uniref:YecA family protein n=1 Tax=Rhizobium leguminosarum TaxID=384 RepID=UPI0024A992C8|nr:SEC-C domain-containing protein [Rhizobium leguminosarum]MDI5929023.1 SEC-C domain-containing protein [Rhizobium leguminosarum]
MLNIEKAAAQRKEAASTLLKDMEAIAARMRDLIVAMPAHELLGYLYAQHMMKSFAAARGKSAAAEADAPALSIDDNQFLLEYVHAVLASDAAPEHTKFEKAACAELFTLGCKLKEKSMLFAMATSANTKDGLFGPDTANIEFHAKSSWVLLRGNRYQVLEGEFYSYVLAPHDDLLKEIYGVGSGEIAAGFQHMADAARTGQAHAIEKMITQFQQARAFAAEKGKPLKDVMAEWVAANADQSKATGQAIDDMFRGGVANVSRHTKLPATLLADLAYQRGEETEFFAAGDYAGTPYRTLPARKKPLIQLGTDYYAVDPCFTRDAGYRALLFNLLQRKPNYKKTFEDRQKTMSESAFADILSAQLPAAIVHQEVYYKDPVTKQWSENDTLILIDDVLFLVEAKAGAAATIASPALDFKRHAQSVQDLVIKAYKQCERFFNYLNSATEVPIYHLIDGKYEQCGLVRRADYRVMIPIGLTVESFSPFSTYTKDLPQIQPLLGKHPFFSMSIDDLFVLKRILPTPGQFAHYMEVRQAMAGIRGAHLFDEFDHLGAYLTKNRIDLETAVRMKEGQAHILVWDGMSHIVDRSFEGEDWDSRPLPVQEFPNEVLKLLGALDTTRAPGWLSAESRIRDFDEKGRQDLANMLQDMRKSLDQHPARYFIIAGEGEPLFVWVEQDGQATDWSKVNDKASAAALAARASNVVGVMATARANGCYQGATAFSVTVPTVRTEENAHIYEDAVRMAQPGRAIDLKASARVSKAAAGRKPARNAPCPCGSGAKFKRCHGR